MRRILTKISVAQILLICFLAILIPSLFMAVNINQALNHQSLLIQASEHKHPETYFTRFGHWAREMNLPYTPALRSRVKTSYGRCLEYSRNMESAAAYMTLLVILFGTVLWMIVAPFIHRAFTMVANSVDELANRNSASLPLTDSGPRDLLQVAKSLRKLETKLNTDEEHQKEFLRHVSHEIKTPLASIKEGSLLLNDQFKKARSHEQGEITDIIVRSSNELNRALENLLNYDASVTSKIVQRREVADLAKLINDVLDSQAMSIKSKNIKIVYEPTPVRCFIDKEQIRTVVANLTSNAIKFSPQGGDLLIDIEEIPPRGARFTIQDQGPGISLNQITQIFEPYYVGNQLEHATIKGTGLGLAIAKQFVEDHNGSIRLLESAKGAKFEVSLNTKSLS